MRIKQLTSLTIAAGACAFLAGCVDPQKPLLADYGYALKSTIAAQTADPEPHYLREVESASSGPRAVGANDRYNKGQVTQPAVEKTTSVGGGK